MTAQAFSLGSAVYIRYKDHVLFKNIQQPIEEAVERETIGWLSKETSEIILIEHDRTTPNLQLCTGQSNGLIILKNCILEMRLLPLQENSKWLLNSKDAKDSSEYALLAREAKNSALKMSKKER
jgi:hypothetical protein